MVTVCTKNNFYQNYLKLEIEGSRYQSHDINPVNFEKEWSCVEVDSVVNFLNFLFQQPFSKSLVDG